jgi:hypothetical protein
MCTFSESQEEFILNWPEKNNAGPIAAYLELIRIMPSTRTIYRNSKTRPILSGKGQCVNTQRRIFPGIDYMYHVQRDASKLFLEMLPNHRVKMLPNHRITTVFFPVFLNEMGLSFPISGCAVAHLICYMSLHLPVSSLNHYA